MLLFSHYRSATPLRGFMILNRLGLNNLIEPIAKDLEFQLQDPFLLYRNAKTKSEYYRSGAASQEPLLSGSKLFDNLMVFLKEFLARLHEVQKSYCSHPGRRRSRSRFPLPLPFPFPSHFVKVF